MTLHLTVMTSPSKVFGVIIYLQSLVKISYQYRSQFRTYTKFFVLEIPKAYGKPSQIFKIEFFASVFLPLDSIRNSETCKALSRFQLISSDRVQKTKLGEVCQVSLFKNQKIIKNSLLTVYEVFRKKDTFILSMFFLIYGFKYNFGNKNHFSCSKTVLYRIYTK